MYDLPIVQEDDKYAADFTTLVEYSFVPINRSERPPTYECQCIRALYVHVIAGFRERDDFCSWSRC